MLAAVVEAKATVQATGDDRLPLPPGHEEAWISVGAGSLELPETVPATELTVIQLVAGEIGDRALDEAVSHAIMAFHQTVSDLSAGYSQIQDSLRAALPDICDITPSVSIGATAP